MASSAKKFTARYNHITRTIDGIGIFNRPGGSLYANVTVENIYIHDMTHWNHDPAHSDGTHNDSIQVQGGKNIAIRYNTVIGSVVAGDGLGPYGTQAGSALIVNQNVSKIANGRRWATGSTGDRTACASPTVAIRT